MERGISGDKRRAAAADNKARKAVAAVVESYIDLLAIRFSTSPSESDYRKFTFIGDANNSIPLSLVGSDAAERWNDPGHEVEYSLFILDLSTVQRNIAQRNAHLSGASDCVETHSRAAFNELSSEPESISALI